MASGASGSFAWTPERPPGFSASFSVDVLHSAASADEGADGGVASSFMENPALNRRVLSAAKFSRKDIPLSGKRRRKD